MAPPPLLRGVLPEAYKPTLHRSIAAATSRDRQQPLRATEPIRCVAEPASSPVPEEERGALTREQFFSAASEDFNQDEYQLKTAYSLYLQAALLNKLSKDMVEDDNWSHADELVELMVDVEAISTGCRTLKEMSPLRLLVLKVEHLLKTNEFVNIFSEVTKVLEERNNGTLEALQRALAIKFDGISFKDMGNSSSSKTKTKNEGQLFLDDLIHKIKAYIAPEEKATDVKAFVIILINSINEVIAAGDSAQKSVRNVSAAADSLMDLQSMTISANLVSNGQEKKKKIRRKNKRTAVQNQVS